MLMVGHRPSYSISPRRAPEKANRCVRATVLENISDYRLYIDDILKQGLCNKVFFASETHLESYWNRFFVWYTEVLSCGEQIKHPLNFFRRVVLLWSRGRDPQKIDVPNGPLGGKPMSHQGRRNMEWWTGRWVKQSLSFPELLAFLLLFFFEQKFAMVGRVWTNFGWQVGALVLPSAQAGCQLIGSERKRCISHWPRQHSTGWSAGTWN